MAACCLPGPRARARLKLFLALSRTPHGLLDMATPLALAFLWLGRLPSPGVLLLGMFTAFAGYTAVYALNDLADYRTDRDNFRDAPPDDTGFLDAVYARHPMAQGLLTLREGMLWAVGWGVAALIGAYLLNPACAALLVLGCLLEVAYCKLLRVSHLRALVNGVVKTLGGVAAVLAVDAQAPSWFLALAFCALFAWEVGGQNIPADWFDLDLDRRQGARTMPLVLGLERAARLSLFCLGAALGLTALLLALAPAGLPWWLVLAATAVNARLLLLPAWEQTQCLDRGGAMELFNRASLYPACLLATALVWFALR